MEFTRKLICASLGELLLPEVTARWARQREMEMESTAGPPYSEPYSDSTLSSVRLSNLRYLRKGLVVPTQTLTLRRAPLPPPSDCSTMNPDRPSRPPESDKDTPSAATRRVPTGCSKKLYLLWRDGAEDPPPPPPASIPFFSIIPFHQSQKFIIKRKEKKREKENLPPPPLATARERDAAQFVVSLRLAGVWIGISAPARNFTLQILAHRPAGRRAPSSRRFSRQKDPLGFLTTSWIGYLSSGCFYYRLSLAASSWDVVDDVAMGELA